MKTNNNQHGDLSGQTGPDHANWLATRDTHDLNNLSDSEALAHLADPRMAQMLAQLEPVQPQSGA